jgi:cytochrome b561
MSGKRARTAIEAIGVTLIALILLSILSKTFRHGLDDTASLASWAVSAGTLALAAVTWRLVVLTRSDQRAQHRRLERERIERILAAVQELTEAGILYANVPGNGPTVEIAKSRLSTAIAFSDVPVGKLGSTELLASRTPPASVVAQAESAKFELNELLAEFDRATNRIGS